MGNSKEATARKFGVAPKRIREWCKQEDKLYSQSDHSSQGKRKRLEGGGRRPRSETLETELYAWIEVQRFKRLRVTRKKVKREALSNQQPTTENHTATKGGHSTTDGANYPRTC